MGIMRTLAVWWLLTGAAVAQTGEMHVQAVSVPGVADDPTSHQIAEYLRSGDPRLVAWGATFAQKKADIGVVPELARLAVAWAAPAKEDFGRDMGSVAMGAVLDSLIQLRATAPAEALDATLTRFPAQALVLATRLPADEATKLLFRWYLESKDKTGYPYSSITRASAMLLALHPPARFAASVVADASERLAIYVDGESHAPPGGGWASPCGDGVGLGTPAEWPDVFVYSLEENSNNPHSSILVEDGAHRILFARHSVWLGWGSCNYVQPPSPATRHALIAQMLGIHDTELPWRANATTRIPWVSPDQYLHDVREAVSAEQGHLQSSVDGLVELHYLTAEEARKARPRLLVSIVDQRVDAKGPLPTITFPDQNVTVIPGGIATRE